MSELARNDSNPVGRPTRYEERFCEQVVSWGQEGLSLAEMAVQLGVGRRTLYDWMDKHPEFSHAVSLAKDGMSAWYARTFRQAGTGAIPNANSGCLIFAAKNQCPDDFKDRRDITVREETGVIEIDFTGFEAIEGEYEELD